MSSAAADRQHLRVYPGDSAHDRRVSEEEAVTRAVALEAAREEFSQQQAKAVANVRRKKR